MGKSAKISASQRARFLDELAQTANVTAAAKAAGMSKTAAYRLRTGNAGFLAKWHAALCEGYARIETELLAEALKAPSARTSDAMLKARAQKDRLRLALLAAHRVAVRGERAGAAAARSFETKGAKVRLGNKIAEMAARGAMDAAAAGAAGTE